jgi:hypothetical protein
MKQLKMNVMKWSSLFFMAATFTALAACSDSNNDNGTTDTTDPEVTHPAPTSSSDLYGNLATSKGILFKNGTQIGNGEQSFCFTGKQTIKKGTYNMVGWIYVRPGAELTIEAGTIIKGDKTTKAALIVEPGGKVYAEGTASNPIVFTSAQPAGSRRPCDWGGLIICGNGTNNNSGGQQIEGGPKTKHGVNQTENDNSGVFRYIRVEFAGSVFATDKEINGVTFGSVGSGTTVDHIQVSYSGDDSFEWFGGSVNCKYLVAYKGWDDDFDTDNGFNGKVQFCLSVRDPRIADTSQSNGFESDNNGSGDNVDPHTTCTFSNVTLIGPMTSKNLAAGFQNTTDYINSGNMRPENGPALGKFQSAMQIRRDSKLNCYNSVALGWPVGLIIDNEKGNCRNYASNGVIKLQNLFFAGMGVTGSDANKKYDDQLASWSIVNGQPVATYDTTQPSFSTTFFKGISSNQTLSENDLKLSDPKNLGQNYCPASGSPLLSSTNVVNLSGFNSVTYAGAFSGTSDTWMDGWTNFDPQNTSY